MRIGELARATHTGVDTIRYYERIGLLPTAKRSSNGYREYSEAHRELLTIARECRALDMPLADTRRLLTAISQPDQECREIDELVAHQLAQVQQRLKALQTLEARLRALQASCGKPLRTAECGILKALRHGPSY
jgi:DNA-binding transcriptional MerR regulator